MTKVSGSGSGIEKILDPDPVCPEGLDPDLDRVCPERLDPHPVNIRPDPKPCCTLPEPWQVIHLVDRIPDVYNLSKTLKNLIFCVVISLNPLFQLRSYLFLCLLICIKCTASLAIVKIDTNQFIKKSMEVKTSHVTGHSENVREGRRLRGR